MDVCLCVLMLSRKHGACAGPSAGGNAGLAPAVRPHNHPWYVNVIAFYFEMDEHRMKRSSEWRLHVVLALFVSAAQFCVREFQWILKEKQGIVMWVKNEVVVLWERCRCLLCWGGLGYFLLGSCVALGSVMLPKALFFFFSDSNHIEPFVSGQFWFLQLQEKHFCPKQSWRLQNLDW